MSQPTERVYEFGPFRLDPVRRVLLRDGRPVPLTAKVFDTLLVLVEHRGQVVPKNELMDALWPDTAVEENNLTQHVSTLRKVLGERAGEHRYVVTVPGRGYSFVAAVGEVFSGGGGVLLQERTTSQITVAVEDETDAEEAGTYAAAQTIDADAVANSPVLFIAGGGRRRHPLPAAVLAALVMLAALLASGYYLWGAKYARSERPAGLAARSIAVLPFRHLGGEPDDPTGAGMADALTSRLSNVRQISVRPTSAVVRYVGGDAAEAGRALGVDAVLEGTVQRSGDRVRVTVQLVGVSDGAPVWAESFDEDFTDIFALQDSISEKVARAMALRLSGEEWRRIRKHPTENVEAYEAYLRGRHFWNKRSEDGVQKSVEHFRRAIDIDPAYGAAYAGLADAYSVLSGYGYGPLSPKESMERARAAALRALEIDGALAEAHASLALVRAYLEYDAAGAEAEFRRALELGPSYATAHQWYSDFLAAQGRAEEALAAARRAAELDPLSPIIGTTLAEHLFFARQYERASEQLLKTLELDPDFIQAHFMLGLTYGQMGRHPEAAAELQKAHDLAGGRDYRVAAALGRAYALSGRREKARQLLGELSATDRVPPHEMALMLASLGQKDRAYLWLQKARDKFRERPGAARIFAADPRFDSLRSDPRFQTLTL